MKRILGFAVALCFLAAAQAAYAQMKSHTETKTKETGPGPNVKTKTETTTGTVKEFEAGKKIKISGPNEKTYSFDLDGNARVEGSIVVGQMAKVEWIKDNQGKEHVTVISEAHGTGPGASAATGTMPGGETMHMKSKTTVKQPGPDVTTKTETVIGTVKEYEAGKKIKVTGPNNKDFEFDLDEKVATKGTIAVGQRVKVQYTKTDGGDKHVTVVSLWKSRKIGKKAA
jgi:hypothetical protein